jgi:hypothetical protein
MEITINTTKVRKFVCRHKEGVIVGAIAILVIRSQAHQLKSMDSFIANRGLCDEYYATQ